MPESTHSTGRMTEEEAAWVRRHVWTAAMRKVYATTPAILTMCQCQYGPCGRCAQGHHDECPYNDNTAWATSKADVNAGWITYGDQMVPTLGGDYSWQVWEAGVRHEGRCPCWLAGHHGELKDEGRQMTIFDYIPTA